MTVLHLILVSLAALLVCTVQPAPAAPPRVRVGDAFAHRSPDGTAWTIGTAAVRARFECRDGRFRLTSFRNRLAKPEREYVVDGAASAPFGVGAQASGSFRIEPVWTARVVPGAAADPASAGLRLSVKKGGLIGFSAATGSDDSGGSVAWANTVHYVDGESYESATDTKLDQGPIWFTYTRANGTGCMDLLGETVPSPELARVPAGYRAPFECSKITASAFHLTNSLELVRVWKAPKDGIVTISGEAKHAGGAPVRLSILRIEPRLAGTAAAAPGDDRWTLISAAAKEVAVGGRPAVQLDFALSRADLRADLHVQAYPHTSILRQWVELENASPATITLQGAAPVLLGMRGDGAASATNYWMCGGTSRPNQGQLESAPVTGDYHKALLGDRSDNYVPWMALQHGGKRDDGCFVTLDHLGSWSLALDADSGRSLLSSSLPELAGCELAPGKRLRLPTVTLGVFHRDLDDMGRRVYDWQYGYLWDYTNSDYFARTKWAVPWFFCSRNLQEQFAARLAWLDMDADLMRTMGIEMLWDDAGWSKYPGWPIPDNYSVVFNPSHEGPDYAETLRYLGKMGMEWLLWFAGRPSAGLMDGKVGSWGDFQWRTDGFGRFGLEADRAVRGQFERFLTANPGSSFHTCDGGSRYAHQFEIQRYADVNYLSDLGRDAKTNHYLSYLDLPDKWCDIIDPLTEGGRYNPDLAWGQLSMVPGWYAQTVEGDREKLRHLMEVYRYLRREGVVGRWSYMMHPRVDGDAEHYYDQRTSRDRTKACLILKHKAKDRVVVYPRGLLPDHRYTVSGEPAIAITTRTGADLMTNGIVLEAGRPGGIIVLGLADMPGSGRDRVAPTAPGRAFARRETNLGHSGVALYWSPGTDDNWISFYEVRRGDAAIGKASVGTYYFDHSPGWESSARYSVRTVDGDGNASDWTEALPLPGGVDAYAALGGHFPEAGRDGWRADSSADGRTFEPMAFIAAAKNPAGDLGGTPNQPGGVEGYWEGPGQARVGRGWQQASPSEQCIRTWSAPRAGRVRVVGRAMKECYRQAMGGPLRVRILLGDRQVWPVDGWAEVRNGHRTGSAHDIELDVAPGDTIRFVLERGTAPDADIIAWMPRIVYPSPEPTATGSVVRVLCGAGTAYTDSAGNVWYADRCFVGGRAARTAAAITNAGPTPVDAGTLRSRREGSDFTYAIPVTPGLYSVRVRFAEPTFAWSGERAIDLTINGRPVLEDFDICHAARGPRLACERVFHNLVPNADGKLVLRFTAGFSALRKTDQAMANAIEVLPEPTRIIRINAGSEGEFIDWNSFVWSADQHAEGGKSIRSDAWTSQASPTLYDQALYQTARSGPSISYAIPMTPGLYTVHLKFAELWLKDIGRRSMHIDINGHRVRANWDPAAAAGQVGMAADIRVQGIAPDGSGRITIRVTSAGANDAILQGIEIE